MAMSVLATLLNKYVIGTIAAILAAGCIWWQSRNKKQLAKQIELNNQAYDKLKKELKVSRETLKHNVEVNEKVAKIEKVVRNFDNDTAVQQLRNKWSRD
jgi:hypothetical protein